MPGSPSALLGLPGLETQAYFSDRASGIYRLWAAGHVSEAFKQTKLWMKDEPKSPVPWVVAATLYFKEDRPKKCLKFCKKALKIKPQTPEAYYWRGRAFEALDMPLEAANEYHAALFAKEGYSIAQEGLDRVTVMLHKDGD